MKRIFTFMFTFAFTSALLFGIALRTNAQIHAQTIIGEVTLVGETTLKVKEDTTQTEYELTASPDKLRDVNTGYRVEVETANGRVLSLTVLGMPMRAEAEPSQRFTVIKQRGQTTHPTVGGTSITSRPNETAVTIVSSEFQPREITIPAGTTVIWINRTPVQQGVAADDGSFAVVLKPGGSFSYAFTQVGRFPYYSQFYGNPGGRGMAGTITVVPAVR